MDKNSNGVVQVSVYTSYIKLKTEKTSNFQSPKKKGRRMLYPYIKIRIIQCSLVVLLLRSSKCYSV